MNPTGPEVRHPFHGKPVTREVTDGNGNLRIEITAQVLTPLRAKVADELALCTTVAVPALLILYVINHDPSLPKLVFAAATGFLRPLFEWLWRKGLILSDDTASVVATCARAAAQARPCIVMVEEMDMLVRPTSAALGFLDGTDTPRNPAGTYLIATTNYPRQIDKRILKRPGRIDRVISVGALRSRTAAAVAQGLLPDDIALPAAELGKALDRTTPAEIREIVATAIRLCAPEPGRPALSLDMEMIGRARASLKQMIATAALLADDTPEEREDLHGRLGPLDDDIPF